MAAAAKTLPPTNKRTHPLYKKISSLNGEVNRLTRDEVREKLKQLHLSDE